MRHVSGTHRVALDWLFDRLNLDPKVQIKYVDTNQLADTCVSKVEVSVFDFKEPVQRTILFLCSGCVQCLGVSTAGFGICAKGLRETAAKQKPKPSNVFSSVERRKPVSKELRETAASNWDPKMKRLGWNTIIYKSQIVGALRKSSGISVTKWIVRRMMRCSTWRPMYWSGDYSCRQRWNQKFTLAAKTNKIWSRAVSLCRDQVIKWRKSKSACLLRFTVSGKDAWSFRSEWKAEKPDKCNPTRHRVCIIIWNWWRTIWVGVKYITGFTSIEILRQIQKDLSARQIHPELFEGIDSIHVSVQWHCLDKEWKFFWMYIEFQKS